MYKLFFVYIKSAKLDFSKNKIFLCFFSFKLSFSLFFKLFCYNPFEYSNIYKLGC